MSLLPKHLTMDKSKRDQQEQLQTMPVKMGAFIPDNAVLNREWRRRLKRAKK